MTTTVTVWHNIATDDKTRLIAMMDGYQPGMPLVPVARYTAPEGLDADGLRVCEHAFALFNVGDDAAFGTPDPLALEYRARKNRSLSVGDVVHITNGHTHAWYACASVGWEAIDEPAWYAIGANTHGTTSLDRGLFNRF